MNAPVKGVRIAPLCQLQRMRRALCCTTRLAPSAYLHLHRRLPGPNASSHPQGRSARRVAHAARDTASRMSASGKDSSCYTFGPIRVPSTQVSYLTTISPEP